MKSFRKGMAANYLKNSDRLHAEKISNTCKKISNSMKIPYQPCLVATVLHGERHMQCLLKEQRQHMENQI